MYDEPENDPEYSILFENIFETTDLPSEQGSRVEYVIITNDTDIYGNSVGDFTTIFGEFAEWKNRMGMPAKVVTVDLIRANYPGVDVPEKIRKFIQEAHQKWGTEYVLLAGSSAIRCPGNKKRRNLKVTEPKYFHNPQPPEKDFTKIGLH